jgi:hypothetical protein
VQTAAEGQTSRHPAMQEEEKEEAAALIAELVFVVK